MKIAVLIGTVLAGIWFTNEMVFIVNRNHCTTVTGGHQFGMWTDATHNPAHAMAPYVHQQRECKICGFIESELHK